MASTDRLELELSVLKCADLIVNDSNKPYRWLVEAYCAGEYERILTSDLSVNLLKKNDKQTDQLDMILKNNLEKHLTSSASQEDLYYRQFEVLLVGITCLQCFVQNNWLGPVNQLIDTKHILPECFTEESKKNQFAVFVENELSVDGEPVYSLAKNLEILYVARYLLLEQREKLSSLQTCDWWLLRLLCIQQKILDDRSATLRDKVTQLMDNIEKQEPLMTDDKNRDLQMEFHIECTYICHMFYAYREAQHHVRTAQKLSGLTVQLTGASGKRTRYQQENTAQLVLQVTRESHSDSGDDRAPVTGPTGEDKVQALLPKMLLLEDDTVLDAIDFVDKDNSYAPSMTALQHTLILAIMEDHRRSQANYDKITAEELDAYITCVLSQVKCWSVCIAAIVQRSKSEKGSRRRVERSMKQLEEMVNYLKKEEPRFSDRSYLFYAVNIPPSWLLQKELAEVLLSVGAVGSAIEIYERLQLWEDAIACYQRLGKTERAETVIREQLAIKETANLWCFLGDVTRNLEHYEKAWEISKHRSARAQRCMGYVYFGKEDYENCIKCFERSLAVNALQVPVWFTLGCAALTAENLDLAVKAFKRCTHLDYDNFEAWNNLATAYIKKKEKKKAFEILKDAIKCNYDNWRIWENYMVTGTDCGEFSEVIRAYHKLMDLKKKWTDVEVLEVLVKAVTEDILDARQNPASKYSAKLKELFGRITSTVSSNAKIWRLYAQLTALGDTDTDKVLQLLQKSHRCVMQASNWQKDTEKCVEVGTQSLHLADTYLKCSEKADSSQSLKLVSSAKLMLKGVVTKIKQEQTDTVSGELAEPVKEMVKHLDQRLQEVVDKVTQLKAS